LLKRSILVPANASWQDYFDILNDKTTIIDPMETLPEAAVRRISKPLSSSVTPSVSASFSGVHSSDEQLQIFRNQLLNVPVNITSSEAVYSIRVQGERDDGPFQNMTLDDIVKIPFAIEVKVQEDCGRDKYLKAGTWCSLMKIVRGREQTPTTFCVQAVTAMDSHSSRIRALHFDSINSEGDIDTDTD
jgi:hypothetical protein